jgi:hypothetical protein
VEARTDSRGVALLIVLMMTLGLLILGQSAMLLLDQVAQRSGSYRRGEIGGYCAEEGLNLGRAWVLQNMNGANQLNPAVMDATDGVTPPAPGPPSVGLFADPFDPTSLKVRDLCAFNTTASVWPGVGAKVTGLAGVCRTDALGNNMYRINLIDDMDEPVNTVYNPFNDKNNVFILRAECTNSASWNNNGQGLELQDVAMIEVNQSGATSCPGGGAGPAGGSTNSAGCGGGYPN